MGALGSLSKSATSLGLDVSEWTLLLFGLLLAIGAIGEESKSKRLVPWHRAFTIVVIIGIAGEFIADGGIFFFSKHLQTISDEEVARLNERAAELTKQAEEERSAREYRLFARYLGPVRDQVSADLRRFSKQSVTLVADPNAVDGSHFMGELKAALLAAGWKVGQALDERLICKGTGVEIWVKPQASAKTFEAADALRFALGRHGFGAFIVREPECLVPGSSISETNLDDPTRLIVNVLPGN